MMNNTLKLMPALVCLTLIGCVTANSLYNDLDAQMQSEWVAWERADTIAIKECDANPVPGNLPPRSKIVEQSKCITRVVNENVIPYTVFPELARQHREKIELYSKQYAEGKISKEDRITAGKIAWEQYGQTISDRANDMVYSAQQRQSQWGDVAGNIADIYRPDPVTNCVKTYNGMRCTHSDGRP